MNKTQIQKRLFELQDISYKEFQTNLIPNVPKDNVIGVRIPCLRKLAKQIAKEENYKEFMKILPHKYQEEYHLHSFLIEEIKSPKECLEALNEFVPYMNSWAVCDSCSPKALKKDLDLLFDYIKRWIKSEEEYVCRFGILNLMRCFLEDKTFKEEYLKMVSEIQSDYYYVKMMQAWFFATALSKQYSATIKILQQNTLPVWVHNKSIQKAIESYRISKEQKEELKKLKK